MLLQCIGIHGRRSNPTGLGGRDRSRDPRAAGNGQQDFTAASTSFGDDPNTHIDPVVCGLPGTLPVLNQKVLEYAVKAAMALNLNIAEHSKPDCSSTSIPISRRTIRSPSTTSRSPRKAGSRRLLRRERHLPQDHRDRASAHGGGRRQARHAGSDRLAGSTHSWWTTTALSGPGRDRQQARPAHRSRGRGIRLGDSPDHALSRRERRQHAGGIPAL